MFEHLKQLDPNGSTSWLELPMIAPGAAVELRFAGEGNAGYFNAMLARAGKRARVIKNKGEVTLELAASSMTENRSEDRALYPVHVLVDWRGIQTKTGTGGFMNVPCTPENRKEFCQKLPDWIFDKIRDHASRPERFVRDDEEAPPDAQEVAGNS